MAAKWSRRRFTVEFKAQAIERLLEGGKGLSEVATELGLRPGQLSAWRNQHLAVGSAEALALREAEQAELHLPNEPAATWPIRLSRRRGKAVPTGKSATG